MPVVAWFTVSKQVLSDPLTGLATPFNLLDLVFAEPWQIPEDAPEEYREQFGEIKYQMPQVVGCAQWIKQPGDDGITFQTQLVIVAPDEKQSEVTGTVTEFTMGTLLNKTVMLTPLIGLRLSGIYRYRVQLRPKGGEWMNAAEYLFVVIFPEELQEMKQAAEAEQAPVSEGAASEARTFPTTRPTDGAYRPTPAANFKDLAPGPRSSQTRQALPIDGAILGTRTRTPYSDSSQPKCQPGAVSLALRQRGKPCSTATASEN